MNGSDLSDEELLNLLREESSKSYGFNLMMTQYKESLYWFIRKMVLSHDDSNDILQDAFLKVYQKINDFRGESKLKTWLFQIAYYQSIDFLKSKRRRVLVPIESVSEVLKKQLLADSYFDGDEAEKQLQFAIAELPNRQREVFILAYFEEMPLKEIAAILNLSEGSIKTNVHLARKKIEKFLSAD